MLAGREVSLENYERTLSPALVSLYERDDYCWVVTGSTEQGRALVDPSAVPRAVAYYAALARQGTKVFVGSPFVKGSSLLPFNFDWSFEYYPLAYARPGPLVTIYRLHGGACAPRRATSIARTGANRAPPSPERAAGAPRRRRMLQVGCRPAQRPTERTSRARSSSLATAWDAPTPTPWSEP